MDQGDIGFTASFTDRSYHIYPISYRRILYRFLQKLAFDHSHLFAQFAGLACFNGCDSRSSQKYGWGIILLESAEGVSDVSRIEPVDLPFTLYQYPGRKTTNLLTVSPNQKAMGGTKKWFEFEFKERVAIDYVVIKGDGYSDFHEIELEVVDIDGIPHKIENKFKDGQAFFQVSKIVWSVKFRPSSLFFSNPQITSVSVYGYELSGLPNIVKALDRIETIKESAIREIEAKKNALDERAAQVLVIENDRSNIREQITQLKGTVSRENGKLSRIRNDFAEQNAKLAGVNQAIDASQIKKSHLDGELENLQRKLVDASASVLENESKLKLLKENLSLFPSELSDFVRQGQHSIRTYLICLCFPASVMGYMLYTLIWGGVDLSTVITEDINVNIAAIIVSRAPYVLVATAIITACFYICRMFILEIVRVNRQRLNLTKISIIAKDISNSAETGLAMSDQEKFDRRLSLKMLLMREHLKDYISRDFEPNFPISLAPLDSYEPISNENLPRE